MSNQSSVTITYGDKTNKYQLNQIGHVCCGGGDGTADDSGLYLVDGKIMDGGGNDVTAEIDAILGESTVAIGDMIIDFTDDATNATNTTSAK